ncbi:MAG TPA: hypothetical protein VEU06_07660 [Micropepsaceae bacterium]|nr:hypothetical protein [Micropepsaceae bacterium]
MRKLVLSAVLAMAPAFAFAADAAGTDEKPAPAAKADTTVHTDAVKTDAGKTGAVKSDTVKTDAKTGGAKTDVKPAAGKSSEVKSDVKPVAADAKDVKPAAHKAVAHKGKAAMKTAPSETKTDSKL